MRAPNLFIKFSFFCSLGILSSFASANTESVHSAKFQNALKNEAAQVETFKMPKGSKLSWERKALPERKYWSRYMFNVINQYLEQLDQAEDMPVFCSKYETLKREQKILVWAQLFVGVSKHESNWNPLDQTFEEDQGNDPYTQKPVYSEGLLQLSYQDQENSPFCNFDWEQDKVLATNNLHRTILNPYRNLYCGIRIMADLVTLNKKVIVSHGGYWSTLQEGSPHQQISAVAAYTHKLPFCH